MSQPTLSSAAGYISEQFFTMSFNAALDAANPPPPGAFAVQINGSGVTVTGVTVDSVARTVTLAFSGGALTAGDYIDFAYTDPSGADDANAIQGTDGADAATFSSFTIVSGGRPGPAAPAVPLLDSGSDSGTPGDGITNHATPTVTGTAAANALVKLYDTDGTTLLGSASADGSGNWSITSSTLADGSHTLKVTQTDGGNNVSPLSAGLALTIDSAAAAPGALALSIASDSGTPGDGVSSVAAPVVTGHAEANAAVRLYDTDGTTVLGSATADGSGNWSITSSNLVTGAHTLTAVQTDVAGNVSAASAGLAYTLDTIGPTGLALSQTSVTMAAATTGAAVATLSATDASAIHYGFATGNGTIDADNGKFAISGTTLAPVQNLTAGTYHLYLKATDAAGNDAFQVFTLTVVDAPGVTSIERAGGAAGGVAAGATAVAYAVTFDQAVTGVDSSDFTLATTGSATGTIASVSGSGTSYVVTVGGVSGDGTVRLDLNPSGTGIANASSTAIAGGYTAGQAYTLDHTAPAAPAAFTLAPADDSGSSNSDGVTSVVTPAFSGVGEANATVNLYDSDGTTLLGSATANGSGNWTITSSTLAAGAHSLTVRQVDAAGNVSGASTALTVQIDTTAAAPSAPVLAAASDSGAAGDGLTRIATPTVTGTGEAFATVRLYDTDGTTVLGSTTADAAGAWSITAATLAGGAHTLTVKQTDLAGTVSAASAALALTVDTTAPAPAAAPVLAPASDSAPAGDGITNVARPVVGGSAEAHATVTLYDTDGSTVLGSATADADGHWSITSAALGLGAHALRVTQTDAAGNVSSASAALALTIVAPPTAPGTTVDGVQVTQQPVTLPGGGSGTQTTVPIVTAGRAESSGGAGTADIPLVTANATTLLLAQLGTGFGLTAAGGASQPAGSALEQLIQSIKAATPGHTAADQGHLTGNGEAFLTLLPTTVPLLVETVTPVTAPGAGGATLTLTGTSSSAQHTALVIDASAVAPGNTLVLQAVDFAAVIGTASVTGSTAGQILTGDLAAQTFNVGAQLGSAVYAGGGDDTLRVVAAATPASTAAGASAADGGAATPTLLHGGLGSDTAVFAGTQASYTVDYRDGHVLVTALGGAHEQAEVVNAETLQFADASVAVANRTALTTLAGLYGDILHRQADVAGFAYWGAAEQAGMTLGAIAVDMIASSEGQPSAAALSGDAAHDIGVLYQAMFGRTADAGGAAFWLAAMQKGATLAQVADGIAHSAEIAGHALAPAQWDFLV